MRSKRTKQPPHRKLQVASQGPALTLTDDLLAVNITITGGSPAVGSKSSNKLMAAAGELSDFDFYVTIKQGFSSKKVRLSVTREAIQVFEQGKKIDEHKISQIKSWKPKPKEIEFLLKTGKKWTVQTTEGEAIVEAIKKQAQAIKAERDAIAAKAAKEEAERKKQADAVAAEKAKWLTLAQLQSGDYSGCSRVPVDEKNKEDWLRPEEFGTVFGKSKEEWGKVPAFKRPMIKKKLGLAPLPSK